MRKLILAYPSLCALVLLISANPVHAQSVLWVSNAGLDANACTQTSPCASFQGAINKGGVSQINCLTSGRYGSFTVTASITIDCGTGNIGNVVVSSGNGINITTASAATIVLRHLSLNGLGTGNYGINTTSFSSGSLIVEDCMIHGFRNGSAIQFLPGSGRGLLQVSDSQIFDNENGISVGPASGQIASVTLSRVELTANVQSGLSLGGTGVVAGTMRDSVVGANGTVGVFATSPQVFFTVEGSSIVANLAFGIFTDSSGSVVNVGTSTIGGNGTGVKAVVGQLISFGNNQMSANGSNGSFTATTPLR